MKFLLSLLPLLFCLQSFSQGFRGLDWGVTISELTSKYPEINWEITDDGGYPIYSFVDYYGGLKVNVCYFFTGQNLMGGAYLFDEYHTSNNQYYKDFKRISKILNERYKMTYREDWDENMYKGNLNKIGDALVLGHVRILEYYEDEITLIIHEVISDDFGGIYHVVSFKDMELVKELRKPSNGGLEYGHLLKY